MNLLTIKTLSDNSIVRSLLNCPTENDALAAMYYELWYSTSDESVKAVVVELVDDNGRVVKCERYERAVEVKPESEVSE